MTINPTVAVQWCIKNDLQELAVMIRSKELRGKDVEDTLKVYGFQESEIQQEKIRVKDGDLKHLCAVLQRRKSEGNLEKAAEIVMHLIEKLPEKASLPPFLKKKLEKECCPWLEIVVDSNNDESTTIVDPNMDTSMLVGATEREGESRADSRKDKSGSNIWCTKIMESVRSELHDLMKLKMKEIRTPNLTRIQLVNKAHEVGV